MTHFDSDRARFDARLAELFAAIARLREQPAAVPVPTPAQLVPCAHTAPQALPAPVEPHARRLPSKLVEAAVWLRRKLAHGPVPATHVYAAAALAGIARRTLERAKRLLGVRSEVDRRAIPRRRWCWALPRSGPVR